MKMHHIRDLLAVADRGSLRAAARYLGIAQPAITRSIRELENELQVALFERQSRGVTITTMGEIFIRRARLAQNELSRATEEISQLRGEQQGSISACLSTASHVALLPNVLKPFIQRYPEVKLNLMEGLYPAAEPLLKNGTLEFYVGPVPDHVPRGELVVEELFKNRRVILARKGHPLAHAKSLAELGGATWITISTVLNAEEELAPLFQSHGLPRPNIMGNAQSALTMTTVVAHSDMLTMLPIHWAKLPTADTLLERIEVKEAIPAPSICMARRANLPLTPAAEYFCDLLRRASGDALNI